MLEQAYTFMVFYFNFGGVNVHIPDGFLSPQTWGTLGIGMIPVWITAARKTAQNLKLKQVPLLSLGAAFAFVIMMFNIPLPNGTTVHPVGAALLAIILGPWAATIGVTIALVIQALFFGDGGVLAIGANSFNLAFVMPFTAYFLYKLISGNADINSRRRFIAAGIAAYVSLNLAALFTSVELGLQPLLFHTVGGKALFFPYTLSQAIPAITAAHLFIGGPVEAVITAMVVRHFQKTNQPLLNLYPPGNSIQGVNDSPAPAGIKKIWLAIIALVILTPLGILATGKGWGEWSTAEIQKSIGYIPQGMAKASRFKLNILPDYAIAGWHNSFWQSATGYIIAAVVGISLIFGLMFVFYKFQAKGEKSDGPR